MRDALPGGSDAPLVVGGGPAGSLCALRLARAGRPVTLLEKSTAAHDKVCGEFLSRESILYLQQHGLSPERLGGVPIRHVRLVTPWFQQAAPLPFAAWSLTRKRLDEALLTEAGSAGVQVVRGAHVSALRVESDGWSATVRDGRTYRAQELVLATGKLDVSGWPRPRGRQPHLLAFKMYYRLTDEQRDRLRDTVELVLFPGGYAGLQPVEDGLANLCLLVDARRLQRSNGVTALQDIAERTPHLRERLQGATSLLPKPLAASNIPYGHLQRLSEPGLWRVGDQAAVIPSFCGDGTAIALHSAALAAAALLRGAAASDYQRTLHRQLEKRMWLATRLSQLLVAFPRASQLTRVLPGMLQAIASATRIPEPALRATCGWEGKA